MSNLGKKLLFVPQTLSLYQYPAKKSLIVKSQLGILKIEIPENILLSFQNSFLKLQTTTNLKKNKKLKALWGLYRAKLKTLIYGLFNLHAIHLKLIGIGYKLHLRKSTLILRLGLSHKQYFNVPETLKIRQTRVRPFHFVINGTNFEEVKAFASQLRALKKPEPYKGKGFLFTKEIIRKKEGKKNKK